MRPDRAHPCATLRRISRCFLSLRGGSYLKRYDLLCQRLIQEQLYTAAAILTSPRRAVTTGEYAELSDMTGLKAFVAALAGHCAAEAARK